MKCKFEIVCVTNRFQSIIQKYDIRINKVTIASIEGESENDVLRKFIETVVNSNK